MGCILLGDDILLLHELARAPPFTEARLVLGMDRRGVVQLMVQVINVLTV
jgi:hypothetical protein